MEFIMRKKKADVLFACVMIIICAVLYFQHEFSYPGFVFPSVVLGIIFLCAVVILITGILSLPVSPNNDKAVKNPAGRKKVFVLIGSTFLYVALMNVAGFYAVTLLFLFITALVLDTGEMTLRSKMVKSFIMTIAVTIIVYVLFSVLLSADIPSGLLL
jgi:hypothetical protein